MGAIADFLAADHDRLDELLKRAGADPAAVALAEKARLDHGALTALLVPTPTPAILGALYAQCAAAAHPDGDRVMAVVRRALAAAGHEGIL